VHTATRAARSRNPNRAQLTGVVRNSRPRTSRTGDLWLSKRHPYQRCWASPSCQQPRDHQHL